MNKEIKCYICGLTHKQHDGPFICSQCHDVLIGEEFYNYDIEYVLTQILTDPKELKILVNGLQNKMYINQNPFMEDFMKTEGDELFKNFVLKKYGKII